LRHKTLSPQVQRSRRPATADAAKRSGISSPVPPCEGAFAWAVWRHRPLSRIYHNTKQISPQFTAALQRGCPTVGGDSCRRFAAVESQGGCLQPRTGVGVSTTGLVFCRRNFFSGFCVSAGCKQPLSFPFLRLSTHLKRRDCKEFCVTIQWHGHLGRVSSRAGSPCHKISYRPEKTIFLALTQDARHVILSPSPKRTAEKTPENPARDKDVPETREKRRPLFFPHATEG
jgi:hypothetical protein